MIRNALTLAALGLFAFSAAHGEAPGSQPASQPTKAAKATTGVQIKVDENGYTPGEVKAKAGQPLTLVFTRTTDKGCGQELVFPKHDIKKSLPLNTPVEITITPKSSEPIAFTCGMGMYRGSIVAE